jgi:hypothetical protein
MKKSRDKKDLRASMQMTGIRNGLETTPGKMDEGQYVIDP